MRMTDTILTRSPHQGSIKGRANHFSPSLPLLVPHWPAAGQDSQHDRAHTRSLRLLATGKTSQHEGADSLIFSDSSSLTLSQFAEYH